ncbi:MAG: MotA/TolQ/ExbB proton channel family protein [Candidatus Krumholzibacteria bacterium]|nr:MotA/TolQ/ExbB proton channel family protein [Candidatus Krumholzibacteria bacterium]
MDVHFVTPFGDFGRSIFSLVFESGPFAKFILLILFVISVISWAIIYDRTRLFLKLLKGGRVLHMGIASKGLALPMETVKRCLPSVEGTLLLEAKRYIEGKHSQSSDQDHDNAEAGGSHLRGLLEGRAMTEISEMEKNLIFLATTASISPFLGLLGTVWGIMSSFLSMGMEGTASIEVVGPGIAEALVTTIAGLGAAITALVAYNLLVRHVRRQETRADLFISRILALTGAKSQQRPVVKSEALYEKKSL